MSHDPFRHTRRLTWAVLVLVGIIMLGALVLMGKDSAAVLAVGIPSVAGLVATWAGITNKWGRDKDASES